MPGVRDRPEAHEQPWPTHRGLVVLLLAYFGLQAIIRVLLSSSTDLDESEQLLLTQRLSLGYGPQPPLYTWIQAGIFGLVGPSIAALALFKNLLLFCTAWCIYWSGRLMTGRHAGGLAAAFSLFFLPQFCWESQRDLTHSVLASTLSAATLLCWWQTLQTGRRSWYLALGLSAGLGLLSKYNFALWPAGLFLATVTVQRWRPRVLDRRMLLTLTVMLLLFLPNAWWILEHRDLAFATVAKFEIQSRGWRSSLAGLKDLVQSTSAFAAPLVVICVLLLWRSSRANAGSKPLGPLAVSLIRRSLACMLVLLLVLIFLFHITNLKQRWFTPLLICLPVLAALQLGERLTATRLGLLRALGLVVMLAILIVIPGRIVLAERMHREGPLNRPYQAAMRQMREAIPASALVLAETRLLGGNLRLTFPGQAVADPSLLPLMPQPPPSVLIWDARETDEPPAGLLQAATAARPVAWTLSTPQFFTADYPYAKNRRLRLGLLRAP